jgi:hypothetical protein
MKELRQIIHIKSVIRLSLYRSAGTKESYNYIVIFRFKVIIHNDFSNVIFDLNDSFVNNFMDSVNYILKL